MADVIGAAEIVVTPTDAADESFAPASMMRSASSSAQPIRPATA